MRLQDSTTADVGSGYVGYMQDLAVAVGSCFGMDPELAPEDALAQLDDLAGQTEVLVERCTKLNSCQEQCAVAQTDFKDPALLLRYFQLTFRRPLCHHET